MYTYGYTYCSGAKLGAASAPGASQALNPSTSAGNNWVTTDAQQPPERAPTAQAGPELRRPRAFSSAHNPKVAGSNPAPAIEEAPGNPGVFSWTAPVRGPGRGAKGCNLEKKLLKNTREDPHLRHRDRPSETGRSQRSRASRADSTPRRSKRFAGSRRRSRLTWSWASSTRSPSWATAPVSTHVRPTWSQSAEIHAGTVASAQRSLG